MSRNQIQREIRSTVAPQRFEIRKNADGSRTVSGYFATFDTKSHDLGGWFEVIAPGAFAESLRRNPDILCFYNHNSDSVLGRVSSGTLAVSEDSKGLRFSVTLPNTSYASDLIALMERGDVSACSFGFSVDSPSGDSWTEDANGQLVRTLHAVTLYEGSIVGMPAYPNTVADLRSCPVAFRSRLKKRDDDDDNTDGDGDYALGLDDDEGEDCDPTIDADCSEELDSLNTRCSCRCERCLTNQCERCFRSECSDATCYSRGCAMPGQDDNRVDGMRIRALFRHKIQHLK